MNVESLGLYQNAKITAQIEIKSNTDDGSGNWVSGYATAVDIVGVFYNRSLASALYTNMFNTQIDGAFITTNTLALELEYRIKIDGNYFTRQTSDNVALLNDAYVIGLIRIEK